MFLTRLVYYKEIKKTRNLYLQKEHKTINQRMEVIGYIAAAFIGILLSLIGGGGSILTVPVMVYLFSVHPPLATSYSLFVVGTASTAGAYTYHRKKLTSIKTALFFGASSMITVFITRKFIIPAIPEKLGEINGYSITQSFLTMVLFAVLMLFVSSSMIFNDTRKKEHTSTPGLNIYKLTLYGIAVGFITGLLGVGGGFILVPALILLAGLPMKQAVGTSLFIIAFNSFTGFAGDIGHFIVDWFFLLKITAIAVAGIYIGSMFSKKIQEEKLKKIFGWFVMVMGTCILIDEIFFKL